MNNIRVNDYDVDVLRRFMKINLVETKEEERVLDEYRNIGWVNFRMKSSLVGGAVKVILTASLTSLGKQFIKRELIFRSPWKKFLYQLINLPA